MKLKQLVAALGLVAAAAPSFASIALPLTGNGELFAVLFDQTAQTSYTVDLGLTMDPATGFTAFNPAISQSFNLNKGDGIWTGFLGASGAVSSMQFAVIAGDGVGSSASNPKRLWTTGDNPAYAITNGQITSATAALNTWANNQATVSNHTTQTGDAATVNGSSWDSVGNDAYFGAVPPGGAFDMRNFWGAVPTATNLNNVGASATMFTFATSSTSSGAKAVAGALEGAWTVTGSGQNWALNYTVAAPVPEVDSMLLSLAGLGALGFVARRRRAR